MNHDPDYDPIRKSWRESRAFNVAWMKGGESMTWTQRIGFAVFSFVLFSSGLLVETLSINSIRNGGFFSLDTFGAFCGVLAGVIFLVPGLLGLRNVLRFKDRHDQAEN
jgi:hypothetical protein